MTLHYLTSYPLRGRPDYRESEMGPSTRYPQPWLAVNRVPNDLPSRGTCDIVDANGYLIAAGVDYDWASWVFCNFNLLDHAIEKAQRNAAETRDATPKENPQGDPPGVAGLMGVQGSRGHVPGGGHPGPDLLHPRLVDRTGGEDARGPTGKAGAAGVQHSTDQRRWWVRLLHFVTRGLRAKDQTLSRR